MPEAAKGLSPNQAAKRASVSRGTIMTAIKANELKAQRDNHGHWQVDTQDLLRWMVERQEKHPEKQLEVSDSPVTEQWDNDAELQITNAELRATVKGLEAQLEAACQERDRILAERERDQERADERIAKLDAERREMIDRLTSPKAGLLDRVAGLFRR